MTFVHKDLTNKHYVGWARFLRESNGWNFEKIENYQLSELRRIIKYAYENTYGYKKLFDENGRHPDDVKKLNDIVKFPFLKKEMIRDKLNDFSAANVPNREYTTTGGSTGVPTGMYRDDISFAKELASKAHEYHRVGWREGDRQIVFRGLQINTIDHTEFFPEYNELRCSTYRFGTNDMETYRQKAFEFQPEWIRCYPSSGYVFARYLKDAGKNFPPIKGILCSSEQLYDFQKKLFTEVFGADVKIFSHYGHYEMSALAGFCEKTDDYHVLPQYGYVELLDKNDCQITKPGAVGEIVATSFIMHATPFIRYRTEDLAVFKSFGCESCGRPYQIWQRIEGRLQELIVTKNGRTISTSMLNMHDDTYDHLKQFQFHQKTRENVVFRFVPKTSCTEDILSKIKNKLQNKLGDDIELILEAVEEIQLTKRGKQRLLIQEMDLKFDNAALSKTLSI